MALEAGTPGACTETQWPSTPALLCVSSNRSLKAALALGIHLPTTSLETPARPPGSCCACHRPPAPANLGPLSGGPLLLDDPIRETRGPVLRLEDSCNQPVLPSFARGPGDLAVHVFVHSAQPRPVGSVGRRL